MAQTLLPLGSAAFSCPHPPYSCNNVVDKRIEQLRKKGMRQPQTKFKIHHLGCWKTDLGGKFFIPQVSDPVWDPHANFQGQRIHLSRKAGISPVKELQKKRHFVQPLERGDSSVKGEFNDQCANQLELALKQENVSTIGSSWGIGRLSVLCNPQYTKYSSDF